MTYEASAYVSIASQFSRIEQLEAFVVCEAKKR